MLIYPPALIDPDSFTPMQFIQRYLARRKYKEAYYVYRVSWFRALDDVETEAVFLNMLNQIREVLKKELAVKYKNVNMLTMQMGDIEKRLTLTAEDAVKTNRSKISDRNSEIIFHQVNVRFPEIVEELKEAYREHKGVAVFAAGTSKNVDTLCKKIKDGFYVETGTVHDLNRKALQSSQSIVNSAGAAAGKKVEELYPASRLPSQHKQRLNSILSVCGKLETSQFLTVEDTYFVGEVTKRYIPTMLSQYESFTDDAPDTLRKEALKLFMQQLEMIEAKLTTLSEHANIQVMDSIKLDASFVKQVTAVPSTSSLTIDRKKDS